MYADNETLEQLEERIIQKNDNPYLTEDMKNKIYKLQNTDNQCLG